MKRLVSLLAVLLVPGIRADLGAQPLPKYEFRGAWIATVSNLDWPTAQTGSTEMQQDQLVEWLDERKAAGINAVVFQIRPESDALFDSPYEPWSIFLTGEQGVAPDPYYDPLAFIIEEAHRRGIEVHAWFNPYRVWISSRNYPRDPSSVYLTKPDWLLTVPSKDPQRPGDVVILNPGLPDVRAYLIEVIRDVATRYDVDGVHFDDYFYPYPPNQMASEDYATYQQYGAGTFELETWRTFNVNMLVRGVWEMLQADAPDVKFGISPFGIWKSGTPSGIVGLSGATTLYADAVNWLDQGWLDYLTPQLYWAFAYQNDQGQWVGIGQDYGRLAPWWADQMNGRHLYTGHGLYRSDAATYSNTLFSADEVPSQVRFNREHGIPGSVFFRTRNITSFHSKGFADSLSTDLYRYPALSPVMPWKDQTPPGVPTGLTATPVAGGVSVSWRPPEPAELTTDPRFYAVYRVRSDTEPDWMTATEDPANLVAVLGDTTWLDPLDLTPVRYHYTVTAVSRNSVESEPAAAASVISRDDPADLPAAFRLDAAWPNPFRASTTLRYALPRPGRVSVSVHDALGRRVAELESGAWRAAGDHETTWDAAAAGVATGTYFVVMNFDGAVRARGIVFVR